MDTAKEIVECFHWGGGSYFNKDIPLYFYDKVIDDIGLYCKNKVTKKAVAEAICYNLERLGLRNYSVRTISKYL